MSTPRPRLLPQLFRALLLLAFSWLQTQTSALAANDKAFFWEAKSKTARVHILGSMHFATPDFYPLRSEITKAFEAADSLVVEADIGDPQIALQMQQQMMVRGTYPPPQTIQDHVSAKTYKLLSEYLRSNGLDPQLFQRYKPGLLVITLSVMELMKAGLSPELGIDLHFLNKARGQKPILQLESAEEQLDLLLDMPADDAFLRMSVEDNAEFGKMVKQMSATWKRGDEHAMERMMLTEPLQKYPDAKPVFEKMFFQRNDAMTDKVEGYLAGSGDYFVIVGAGHLIGETGIIAQLKRGGYEVTRR